MLSPRFDPRKQIPIEPVIAFPATIGSDERRHCVHLPVTCEVNSQHWKVVMQVVGKRRRAIHSGIEFEKHDIAAEFIDEELDAADSVVTKGFGQLRASPLSRPRRAKST